jgi:regulator of protease activity HflC (stomatin/prohibitin superfamily)
VCAAVGVVVFLVILVVVIALLVAILISAGYKRVDSGDLGLVLVRGKPTKRTLTPGVHIVRPLGREMIVVYPSNEMSFRATSAPTAPDTELDLADGPVQVVLGDRTVGTVGFTLRFRLDPDRLGDVHTNVGAAGIKPLVRDVSARAVGEALREDGITAADLFGARRSALEARIEAHLREVLDEQGLVVTMFSIREIDLGRLGDVIQETVAATAELEREAALTQVREARARNEAALDELVRDASPALLRYLQIDAARRFTDKWDGRTTTLPDRLADPGRPVTPATVQAVADMAVTEPDALGDAEDEGA